MINLPQARSLALGVAICISLGACDRRAGTAQKQDAKPRTVFVTTITNRPIDNALHVNGPLVAREEAAVAPQLSGYQVARVLADQGDWIKAGQVIAVLDDTLLKSDIAQQQANVAQVQVAAEQAQQQAARVAGLDNSGVLSAEALSQRRLAARSAQAQLVQARALLAGQQVRHGLMAIRAPVSGRILERTVRPGDVASPTTIMFRIARDGAVELNAEIPEQQLKFVTVGEHAQVTLADGTRVSGRVRLVNGEIDTSTKLGHARIELPVRSDFRVGGFAEASVKPNAIAVRSVREGAVQYSASGATIKIVGAGNVASTKSVTIGRRGGGYVELVDGPPAGTRALLGSQGFVLDGDRVRPVAAPEDRSR